jgi:flavin-binding protein dodecin
MADEIPGGVVKIVELVGSSPNSFSDAVRNAVRTASKTIRNIRGVDVIASSADVDSSGNLTNYKVDCKLAFLVDSGNVQDAGQQTISYDRQESTSGGVPNLPSQPSTAGGEQSPFGNPPPTGGGTSPTGPS